MTIECIWLCKLLVDLHALLEGRTPFLTDSQSAIVVAQNHMFHARTKHMEIQYLYVKERFDVGEINLIFCPTHHNVADLFTKALTRESSKLFTKFLDLFPFGN